MTSCAVSVAQSPSNEWQKFDYLLEFGQWLYCNEFPVQDSLEQIEWAIDILLNMKFEKREKEGMWCLHRARGLSAFAVLFLHEFTL